MLWSPLTPGTWFVTRSSEWSNLLTPPKELSWGLWKLGVLSGFMWSGLDETTMWKGLSQSLIVGGTSANKTWNTSRKCSWKLGERKKICIYAFNIYSYIQYVFKYSNTQSLAYISTTSNNNHNINTDHASYVPDIYLVFPVTLWRRYYYNFFLKWRN